MYRMKNVCATKTETCKLVRKNIEYPSEGRILKEYTMTNQIAAKLRRVPKSEKSIH